MPLAGGWLLVDPDHVGLLASLAREGARSVSGRRRLTPAEATVLQLAELAAYDARSGTGTRAGVRPGDPAPSWLTAEQAGKQLEVSPEYVRRLARTGALVAERHGRAWMVSADGVAAHRKASGRACGKTLNSSGAATSSAKKSTSG